MTRAGDAYSSNPDLVRAAVPVFAAGIAVLAITADPGTWWESLALAAVVSVFAAWARWGLPLPALTLGVLFLVVGSQLSGGLEPGFFEVSLLALVLTGFEPLRPVIVLLVLLAMLSPVLVTLMQDGDDAGWPNWVIGIVFPAVCGWIVYRQERISFEVEEARRLVSEQTVLEERRRIARDVHDLVGHGLAAMMLQVTSARHVLRGVSSEADEALKSAEDVGRASMQELRRTVALLRDGDDPLAPPLPQLEDVQSLAEAARTAGLPVTFRASGDQSMVDAGIGLALYRITQECLANASRHAPAANSEISIDVTAERVLLRSVSKGALGDRLDDPARPRYGVRGMQERAEAVGGRCEAGPTDEGWVVRCEVPLTPSSAPADPKPRPASGDTGAAPVVTL